MSLTIFEKRIQTAQPIEYGAMSDLFSESAGIVNKAMTDFNPYAVCLMLSGGDDSITALMVAVMLKIKIDFVIHGVTGTGLPEVRKYVREICEKNNLNLIEADAGTAFEDRVRRKGFFGKGIQAHKFSYHVLKWSPIRKAISKHIRKRVRGRKVILLNGVRVEESENRSDNFADNPYRLVENNWWVNIIHWWTHKNCLQLLQEENVTRNPVSIALGRSGECNCGTVQNEADRIAASEFNPEWGRWMMNLRKEITAKFGWDIGQNPNQKQLQEMKLRAAQLSDFMPMCVGCKAIQSKLFSTILK